MSRQYVMLPSGSSRNKIEALADYLDALIVKNPGLIGQATDPDDSTVFQLPKNPDGSTDFSVVTNPPPASYDGPLPFFRNVEFSGYLNELSNSTIQFDVEESFMNGDGQQGLNWSTFTSMWSGTIDDYKKYVVSQAAGTPYDETDKYQCIGRMTVKYQTMNAAPEILGAQMKVGRLQF